MVASDLVQAVSGTLLSVLGVDALDIPLGTIGVRLGAPAAIFAIETEGLAQGIRAFVDVLVDRAVDELVDAELA